MDDNQDQDSNLPPSATSIKILDQNAKFSDGSRSQPPSTFTTAPASQTTTTQSQLPPSVLTAMIKSHQTSATTGRGITGSRVPSSPHSHTPTVSTTPTFYPPNSKLTSKNTRFQTKLSAVSAFSGGYKSSAAPTADHSQETHASVPLPPTVMTSLMTPYQTSAITGARGTSNVTRTNTILAAPSKSAEEQWLESVKKKSGGLASSHLESQSQATCSRSQCSRSRNQTHVSGHEDEDDICSLEGQLEEDLKLGRERLRLMQSEVDHVIGVMRMDFGKPSGGMGADKRLSEIYHHCPDYPDYGEKGWRKKGGWEKDGVEEQRRLRRYRKQMCVLITFLILLLLLVAVDYWLLGWFIGRESGELLKESNARMEGLKNQKENEVIGGDERSLEGMDDGGGIGNESTTVTVITQIEEEDIKATILGGDGEEEDGNGKGGITEGMDEVVEEDEESLRRGHDVLEPAHVNGEEEEGMKDGGAKEGEEELVAVNLKV